MILLAFLLVGSAPQPVIAVSRLYGEFKQVCGGAIDSTSVANPALVNGWSPISLGASPKLAAEVSQYDNEMWAHWNFQNVFYTKTIDGRPVYLHLSTGTPDGITVHGCAVYDLDRTPAPADSEVRQAVGASPEYVSTDFGGSTYDFADGILPSGAGVEISWLTNAINPRFRGDRQAEAFAQSVLGPKRLPTLTIKTSFLKKAS